MGQLPDLQEARRRLGLALEALCHDRWVLAYLRGGLLQPIAASGIATSYLQSRPLMPLSRRALYEKRPLVVNSVIENPNPSNGYDWELDWPAILYAPVGETLAPMVEALRRPLGRLSQTENEVAQLLSYGLSEAEIAKAMKIPERRARALADEVARKLRIVSLEVVLSFPELPVRRRELRL